MADPLEHTVTSLLAAKSAPAQEELAVLYERATPALLAWVELHLRQGLRGRVDSEEVVQETWLRALRTLSAFDPRQAPFRAWLIGIARNVLLEAIRSLGRHPGGVGSTTNVAALANHPDALTTFTREAARSDTLRRFVERAARLGEDRRVLICCCGLEGLGPEEAARRLNISPAAAAKRWQRLRTTLAAQNLPRDLLVD